MSYKKQSHKNLFVKLYNVDDFDDDIKDIVEDLKNITGSMNNRILFDYSKSNQEIESIGLVKDIAEQFNDIINKKKSLKRIQSNLRILLEIVLKLKNNMNPSKHISSKYIYEEYLRNYYSLASNIAHGDFCNNKLPFDSKIDIDDINDINVHLHLYICLIEELYYQYLKKLNIDLGIGYIDFNKMRECLINNTVFNFYMKKNHKKRNRFK